MMTQTFDDISGLDVVLGDVTGLFSDMSYREPLAEFSDELSEIHQGYFDAETGPSGQMWPAWYFRRPGTSPDHKTLDVSGRLRGSLFTGGADNINDIDDKSITWGTSVPYAYKHQDGGEYPVETFLIGRRGGSRSPGQTIHLPQREHVGITDAVVDKLAEKIADHVVDQLTFKG